MPGAQVPVDPKMTNNDQNQSQKLNANHNNNIFEVLHPNPPADNNLGGERTRFDDFGRRVSDAMAPPPLGVISKIFIHVLKII